MACATWSISGTAFILGRQRLKALETTHRIACGFKEEILVTQRMYCLLVRTSSEKRTRCSVIGLSVLDAALLPELWLVSKFLPKRADEG